MDKSALKALILTKGQQLGLDPAMIESMLVAKPSLTTQTDQAQLQGTQLGNLQKSMNIEQDQVNAPLTTTKNQLDIEAKQLAIQGDKEAARKAQEADQNLKKGEDAIYNLLKKGSIEFSQAFAAKYPQIAERYVSEGGKTITAQNENEKKAEKAKQEAGRIVADLENQYFDGGDKPKLAYDRFGGFLQEQGMKVSGDFNPKLSAYLKTRESIRPKFVKAMGDTGAFSEPEQKAAVADIPTHTSSPKEAAAFFRNVYTKFGLPVPTRIQKLYNELGGSPTTPTKGTVGPFKIEKVE